PHVVLARSREEGFRYALRPDSTVLVASHRHFWRTSEERLARTLVADGHKVALLHIEKGETNARRLVRANDSSVLRGELGVR
ncbi:MAG TPA: hypothetical protein VII41_14585, partial [Steroidobacteraceae bacterium]